MNSDISNNLITPIIIRHSEVTVVHEKNTPPLCANSEIPLCGSVSKVLVNLDCSDSGDCYRKVPYKNFKTR